MTSYTNIFTGNPVQTSPTSYRAFTIAANTTLSWPIANEDDGNVSADVMEVTASSGSLSLLMPPANQTSNGKATLIRNMGANTFTVKDSDGNTIQSIAASQVFWIYVRDNSSVAGTWGSFQFGTGTSSADANTLAGAGLFASASTLNLEFGVNDFASNDTLTTGYRATVANWTGGAGTFSFSAVATLGDGWFCLIKNSGTGVLALDPNASELIDQASSINLDPLESCIVVCDGAQLFTIGRSSESTTPVFTRLVKSVAGGTDVTLTASEAAYDIIEFTGALTANINLIVPTTVARWWFYNNTTGSYSLTIKTAAGTGIALTQGTRQIMHCDGTNVVLSVTAGTGTVTSVATGTGLSGGPITTTGTISLANTAVTAGSYGSASAIPVITVDAQGRLTAASTASPSAQNPFSDASALVKNSSDATKLAIFSASSITTATTRTYTLPDANGTVALTSDIPSSFVPWSNISGFIPSSIAGTSTTASMTISAGQATDSTNAFVMSKATTSAWSVSNGNAALGYQGGTTLPNSDTIHLFVCYGGSGTTIFAHNGLTPTPPAGYNTYYRRIGSFNTDGSGAPIAYVAVECAGGGVRAQLTALTAQTEALTTSASTVTISGIPADIRVAALFRTATSVNPSSAIWTSLDSTDAAPAQNGTAPGNNAVNDGGQNICSVNLITNTSGQIRGRASTSTNVFIYLDGWEDFRR